MGERWDSIPECWGFGGMTVVNGAIIGRTQCMSPAATVLRLLRSYRGAEICSFGHVWDGGRWAKTQDQPTDMGSSASESTRKICG
jgi:hypothetical protein